MLLKEAEGSADCDSRTYLNRFECIICGLLIIELISKHSGDRRMGETREKGGGCGEIYLALHEVCSIVRQSISVFYIL